MARARRRGAGALAIAALLLGTVACTDDDGGEAEAPTTTAGEPGGGTLRLGIGGDLIVDPADASLASPRDLMVIDLLHDGLTRLDEQGVPQPVLAESWEANDANTAFRFHLDPEATFTSGRAVTPADVIGSLQRIIKAGDTSLAALSLEAVKGFRAYAEGEADHVSGLTAPGGNVIRFALQTPLSVLPEVLSNPLLSVVDDSVADDDRSALDLSGDWSVAAADAEDLTVERREGADVVLDAVELRRFDDEEAAYDAFDDGEVEWAIVPSSRFEAALEDHTDAAFAGFQAELYFGMNVSRPTLAREPLRQAILMAIDRDAIVEQVYSELADPLPTIVPAGVVGHDAERCPTCAYDPEAATAIVQFAFPDGKVPTLNIDYDRSAAQQEMAELVAADLDAVGIPTKLRPLPIEEYTEFVVSGDQELFSFGWIGAYASPDAYLAPLFGSAANDNLTNYRSAPVDRWLARARAGSDRDANAERWAAAEATVLKAAVVVPIAQFRTQVVIGDDVEGLFHAVDGTVDWTQVQLTG